MTGELNRSNTLRNMAHSAKRQAIFQLSTTEKLSEKRLRRAQYAEAKLGKAREHLDEYAEHFTSA